MGFFDRFRGEPRFEAPPEKLVPEIERKEIKYPLTPEKLEGKLEPLNGEKLEETYREFCNDLPNKIVMVFRKGAGPNNAWSADGDPEVLERIRSNLRNTDTSAFETFYTSTFARGFRRVSERFPQLSEDMENDPCFGGVGNLLEGIGDISLGKAFPSRKNHSNIIIKDTWIRTKTSPEGEKPREVMAPWKIMNIVVFESGEEKPTPSESRLCHVNITIILGQSDILNQAYDFPSEEVESWLRLKHGKHPGVALYDMMIRALRSDPQFVVRALYDVAPEIFITHPDNKKEVHYIPSRQAIEKMTVAMSIPEFDIAGIKVGVDKK